VASCLAADLTGCAGSDLYPQAHQESTRRCTANTKDAEVEREAGEDDQGAEEPLARSLPETDDAILGL